MSKIKPMTITQFQARFSDDDVCLEHIFRARYGDKHTCAKCQKDARYYRVKARRCHECEHCGHQVYATAGTPFEKTKTPLSKWFFAMFLFCASRNGVAAKELQRQLGVTYKCAWRMGHEIRKYMGQVDGDAPLGGAGPEAPIVEADKAFIGGYDKIDAQDKAVVLGMIERGGDVIARVVPGKRSEQIIPVIHEHVRKGTRIATDDAKTFFYLPLFGYQHESVNHKAKEWVRGDVHTNTIEAFWGNLKRGITGTYVWVSKQHLQKYLCEFEFRHNLRKTPELMFERLLRAFPKPMTVARHAP